MLAGLTRHRLQRQSSRIATSETSTRNVNKKVISAWDQAMAKKERVKRLRRVKSRFEQYESVTRRRLVFAAFFCFPV